MEELAVITLTYELYKKLATLTTTIDKKYRYTLAEPVMYDCSTLLEHMIDLFKFGSPSSFTYEFGTLDYPPIETFLFSSDSLHRSRRNGFLTLFQPASADFRRQNVG